MQTDKSQSGPNNQDDSTNYNQDAQIMPPDVGTISRLLSLSNAVYIIACVIAVLATFGIVYFGNRYTRLKEKELEAYKSAADERIADANKKAADANAVAAAALADAETARAEQDKLKNDSLKLEVRLRELEQTQSKIAQTNVEAQEKIKRFEEAEKPRIISEAQSTQVSNLLKPFAGESVEVRLYAQETEAAVFSNQVSTTLERAGLKANKMIMMGGVGTGFGVAVHDVQSAPKLATAIILSFRSAGIQVFGVPEPDQVSEGKFFVFIGAKLPVQ